MKPTATDLARMIDTARDSLLDAQFALGALTRYSPEAKVLHRAVVEIRRTVERMRVLDAETIKPNKKRKR
jgi:hypothetical protein